VGDADAWWEQRRSGWRRLAVSKPNHDRSRPGFTAGTRGMRPNSASADLEADGVEVIAGMAAGGERRLRRVDESSNAANANDV